MFQKVKNWLFPDKLFGALRSSQWPRIRKEQLAKFPYCQICGKRGLFKGLEAHHIQPFHLMPFLELDPENLITLCRTHHYEWGHFFSWKSFNKDVKQDVLRIKSRP